MPPARPAIERFNEKVRREEGGCWIWLASANPRGYGHLRVGNRLVTAHRYAYEMFVGAIPHGYDVDHLCRNRRCVNPDHLEAVTHKENVLRGEGVAAKQSRATRCVRGHEFTPRNTRISRGKRVCRECERLRAIRRRQESSSLASSLGRSALQPEA